MVDLQTNKRKRNINRIQRIKNKWKRKKKLLFDSRPDWIAITNQNRFIVDSTNKHIPTPFKKKKYNKNTRNKLLDLAVSKASNKKEFRIYCYVLIALTCEVNDLISFLRRCTRCHCARTIVSFVRQVRLFRLLFSLLLNLNFKY